MSSPNFNIFDVIDILDGQLGSTYNNSHPDGLSIPIKYNRSRRRTRVKNHPSKRRSPTPFPRDTFTKEHPPDLIEEKKTTEFNIIKKYNSRLPIKEMSLSNIDLY